VQGWGGGVGGVGGGRGGDHNTSISPSHLRKMKYTCFAIQAAYKSVGGGGGGWREGGEGGGWAGGGRGGGVT